MTYLSNYDAIIDSQVCNSFGACCTMDHHCESGCCVKDKCDKDLNPKPEYGKEKCSAGNASFYYKDETTLKVNCLDKQIMGMYDAVVGGAALSLTGIIVIAVIFGTCFIACFVSAIKLCCLKCRDDKQRVEI